MLFLCAAFISMEILAVAVLVFCWSFGLPYRARYAIGVFAVVVTLKWILRGERGNFPA